MAYDSIAHDYAAFVEDGLSNPQSVLALSSRTLLKVAGPVYGLTVCDLACGEGYLTRQLAAGAQQVVGIDISASLLQRAREHTSETNVAYIQDDAQKLNAVTADQFDLVLCNLALMDVPDLAAVYQSVWRVLRPSGRFVFSITHPCFQAPHTAIEVDEKGNFRCRTIASYAEEGFWRSDNPHGIRGKVGAQHRTLSTYLNRLIENGFRIGLMVEPALPAGEYEQAHLQAMVKIPSVLVMSAFVVKTEESQSI